MLEHTIKRIYSEAKNTIHSAVPIMYQSLAIKRARRGMAKRAGFNEINSVYD